MTGLPRANVVSRSCSMPGPARTLSLVGAMSSAVIASIRDLRASYSALRCASASSFLRATPLRAVVALRFLCLSSRCLVRLCKRRAPHRCTFVVDVGTGERSRECPFGWGAAARLYRDLSAQSVARGRGQSINAHTGPTIPAICRDNLHTSSAYYYCPHQKIYCHGGFHSTS